MSVEIGTAYVSVIPGAKGFAKTLRQEIEREFATADLGDLVTRAFGNRPVAVPVRVDTAALAAQVSTVAAEVSRRAKIELDVDVDGGRGLGSLAGKLPTAALSALVDRANDLRSAVEGVAGSAVRMGGNLSGALTSAAGPAGLAAGALILVSAQFTALAAAAVFAIPAITAVSAALASIPTGITGAGAALATLGLGFKGISEAFKPKSGGGGGGGGAVDLAAQARQVAQATRGVEAAQRGLVRAQRDVVAAQRAVNEAIAGEIERRQDLSRELRSARLDQADAALGVDEALRSLNFARESGDIPAIRRAQLEFEQAQARVEDTADATDDLQKEQTKAAKTSIRDSDAVRAAMERQQAAVEGIASATDQLASAQESLAAAKNPFKAGGGGGGGGYGEVVKLAPAAQRFVDAVKALKPAFEDLRLNVQQRLFVGLDKTVTNLGRAWIPQLKITLGNYADTFNGFFKDLGANLAEPKFIKDLATGAEGFRAGLAAIGKSISGKLVPAFGALSAKAAPFVQLLGEKIAGIVTKFSDWVLAGEKSGALQEFFTNASEAVTDIAAVGKQAFRIIGNIIEIIVGKQLGTSTQTPIQQFRDGLEGLADYLDDPKNQQKIRDFLTSVQDAVASVGRGVQAVGDIITTAQGWYNKIKPVTDQIANVFGGYTADGTRPLGEALWEGIVEGFQEAAAATGNAIAETLWRGPNSLIGRIRSGLGIASPSRLTTIMGWQLIDGLIKGIGDRFAALAARVRQIPGRIQAGIGNAAAILLQRGRDVVSGLTKGIGERFQSLQSRASSIRSRISNAVGNTGNLLYNAGRNVVIGLWNGIASLGGWLASRVRSFVSAYVPGPIQNALGINSPSKVAAELGRAVPQGLAVGIESGSGLVESAARSMADAALPSLGPALVGNPARGLATAAEPGRLRIEWVGGDGPIIDAFRHSIKISYNGDPVAALSSR